MTTSKKDFSFVEGESGVYSRIKEATTDGRRTRRSDYTEEEKAAAIAAMNTQGKKGMKYPKELRMNMAFSAEVSDFIRTMSQIYGINMTAFTNKCMTEYMNEHRETYEKAKELRMMTPGWSDKATNRRKNK